MYLVHIDERTMNQKVTKQVFYFDPEKRDAYKNGVKEISEIVSVMNLRGSQFRKKGAL